MFKAFCKEDPKLQLMQTSAQSAQTCYTECAYYNKETGKPIHYIYIHNLSIHCLTFTGSIKPFHK